jgi:lipopolysaccharide export system permease protein
MKIYQKFISKLFFKNFIILFLALELFFTGIDLMQNFKHLPHSANLQIIYATNIFLNFVNYTLPLSLIFAMLTTIFQLIRSNELVSLYALGASKKQVIMPIFLLSLFVTLLYIALNASAFVKANEFADSIKRNGEISDMSKELFLKSDDDYVYFETLNPLQKEGTNIKIFRTKDTNVIEIIKAKRAIFKDNHWELEEVSITNKPDINAPDAKLTYKYLPIMITLQGFKPQIIDNLFKGKSKLTIQDSFAAIKLLKAQNLKTDKIRANLYIMIAFPLFAPLAILALFYPLPAQRRASNIALLSTLYIFAVLMIWGLLFTMAKISFNGAILPEFGIILPLFLLLLISLYLIYKNR